MDGTADPAPSVELDGELSRWSFQYETSAGYSDAVMADVSPIFVTGVSLDGLDEATLTVTFDMRYYAADGPVIMYGHYSADTWHVTRGGTGWRVDRIHSNP